MSRMRYAGIAIAVAAALGCASQPAQPKFEHQDECINPERESMSWRMVYGEIAGFAPDGELQLANPPRRARIVAVEIDVPAADEYLKSLIGKRVEVWVNPSHFDDEIVTGSVDVEGVDIGRTLLANGLARHVKAPPYSVSDYTDCLYRIAEREAKGRR